MWLMTATAAVLLGSPAEAQGVPPPPPLVDRAEASYVGLSHVAVCAPARMYTVVLAAPFGEGPRVETLKLGDAPAPAEDLARLNNRLATLKSFSSLTVQCATGGDVLRIEGYPKVPGNGRPQRVEVTLSGGRALTD